MKALDVMVRNVVTVKPDDAVADAVRLLAEHDISALPVVDDGNNVVGVISEADLLHRDEMGTEKQRPWWLEAVTPASTLAGSTAGRSPTNPMMWRIEIGFCFSRSRTFSEYSG